MKLKKIASLALAGIMAVSMLTACNTTGNTPDTGDDDQGTTTPVTGYSAKLGDEIAELSTIAGKAVTWSESSDLQSNLNYQVGNVGYNALTESFLKSLSGGQVQYVGRTWRNPGIVTTVISELQSDMNAEVDSLNVTTSYDAIAGLTPNGSNYEADDYNTVMLFVVDNGVDLNNAMDQISKEIVRAVQDLDDDFNAPAGNPDPDYNNMHTMNVDYEYTGSVATCTKTFESGHGVGVSFIAVEIVRHIA